MGNGKFVTLYTEYICSHDWYILSISCWYVLWISFLLSLRAAVTRPESGSQGAASSVTRGGTSNFSSPCCRPYSDRVLDTAWNMS